MTIEIYRDYEISKIGEELAVLDNGDALCYCYPPDVQDARDFIDELYEKYGD